MLLLLSIPVVDSGGSEFDFTVSHAVDLSPLCELVNDAYWEAMSAELRTLHRLGDDLLRSRPGCSLRASPSLRIEEL